jgi:hypothetical protein
VQVFASARLADEPDDLALIDCEIGCLDGL